MNTLIRSTAILGLFGLAGCSTHPGFWRIELNGTLTSPTLGEQPFFGRGIQDWAGYYPSEGDESEVEVQNWKGKVDYSELGLTHEDHETFRWEFYFTLPDHRVLEDLADLEWESNTTEDYNPIGMVSLNAGPEWSNPYSLRPQRIGCFDTNNTDKKAKGRLRAEFEDGYVLEADYVMSGFGSEIDRDGEGDGGLFGGGDSGGGSGCRDSSLGICTESSSSGFTDSCENDGDNNTTVVSSCSSTGISCSGTGTDNVTGAAIPVTIYFDDCGDIQGYSVNSFCGLIGSSETPC